MARRASIGLRTRLLLLALVAVMPAFGLLAYTAVGQRQQAMEHAKKDALNLVRMATQEQRRLIADTRERLIRLSQQPAIRQPGTACRRAVVEFQRSQTYFANVGVATLDGDIFCSARPLRAPVNIGDRRYFRHAAMSLDFSIGDYQVGRITGVSTINFGYPVSGSGGNLHAVAFAALDLSWLKRLISGIELPASAVIVVADGRGTVLAQYAEREEAVANFETNAPPLKAVLAGESAGTIALAGPGGASWLYAMAPLHEEAGGNIDVVVGIPTDIAFADMRRGFARSLASLSLVTLLVLLAAWVGSDVFVLRRVRALTAASSRLAQGDLQARSGLPHGADDLGRLAGTFDRMATALQRTNRALKTLSAGNRTLVRATDEQQLLADMCRLIVEVGGYRFAWIGYAENDAHQTVRPVMQYGAEGDLAAWSNAIGHITWADTERGRGPAGTAIRTAKPYVARNVLTDPNFAPWRELAVRRGYAAVVAFPLLVRGTVVGALSIYSHEPDAFDTDELELLNESAEDLAFGITVLRARQETEQAHATIKRLAYYDGLTNLPNHAQFVHRLQGELARAGTQGEPLALVVIYVNRLRDVSDALGFYHGDLLLKEVSVRLRQVLPPDTLVARARGDEFAALLPATGAGQATTAVRQILDALRAPFAVGNLNLDVRATAGVALFPQDGSDPTQLLRYADVALKHANKSRKEYAFYEAGYDADSTRRLAMAGELRHAIDAGELVLYYQPKVDMDNNRVCGAEALVRWRHPQRGLVPPDEFITLAEDTGLIKPLTEAVLAAAVAQASAWRRAGVAVPIAVNLSARDLLDLELPDKLQRLFQANDGHARWLELEITESAVMEDPEAALHTLTRLSEMGIALFIDDFGTGYSSLSYLKKLPVDAMKIDKSFVLDMLASADSAAIVRSTIGLAHDLELKVVAEGVENAALWNRLTALGCDVAQGYYISKPLPADPFEQWLRHDGRGSAAAND